MDNSCIMSKSIIYRDCKLKEEMYVRRLGVVFQVDLLFIRLDRERGVKKKIINQFFICHCMKFECTRVFFFIPVHENVCVSFR